MKRIALVFSITTLLASTLAAPTGVAAVADTTYVGSAASVTGGSCADPDFSTLENSINFALAAAISGVDTDGDTIVICNGTYRYEASIAWIEQSNDFSIVAEDNGSVTLDGTGVYGLISVAGESELTIDGIRFTRAGDTGAIYRPQGNLRVVDSEFIANNKSEESAPFGMGGSFGGGAINGDANCEYSHQIEDSVFRSNTGPTGAVSTCSLMVVRSTFINNKTKGWGGALYVCDLAVADSYFARNSALRDGGAINACTIFDMDDNEFERNSSRGNGGAIAVVEPMAEPGRWTGNSFLANRARLGGAIFMDCRPANGREVIASIKRSNRLQLNSGGGAVFNRDDCDRP